MWRKAALCLVLLAAVWFFIPGTAYAADTETQVEEQLEKSGVKELLPLIPEEGEGVAENEELIQGDISGWTPQAVFSALFKTLREKLGAPLKLLGSLCGILLLCALLRAISGEMENSDCQGAFRVAGSLCASAAILTAVIPVIERAAKTIGELSAFMMGFIPVYSGVIAVSGRPASAVAYQTVTLAAAQFFSQLANTMIVPLVGIFLAVCAAGSVTEGVDVKGIAQGAKSLAMWVLGLCLTIFVALLTLQSLTAGAADNVGTRAVKFVISSAVPVVGGALSEAYSSLSGCLGLVKNAVGIFGIVVMAASFLPVLISVGLTMLALNLAGCVGDILGESRTAGIMRSASSALAVLGGLILCYGMMILSSAAILLWMGTPG